MGASDAREVVEDFTAFFRREYPAAVRLAYALTGSAAAAEDLAQDAFVSAQRNWHRVADYDKPGAWLRRVLVHRCVSRSRRLASEGRALLRLRNRPLAVVEIPEQQEEVWAAVRRLPARQAEVIALTYLEDRPADEVATILGCGVETVRTHLRRARERLATELDESAATTTEES